MKKITLITLILVFIIGFTTQSFALEDGAYLIGRSTSYANPVTGKTMDGGTNISLGDSMVANIVEEKLLLEKKGDDYYLTIGLGLASNIENVRMNIMDENGEIKEVEAVLTGTSEGKDDKVNHYRVKLDSINSYVSPQLFVIPMDRDVQFFIEIDENDLEAATGIYTNEIAEVNPNAKIEKKEEVKEEVKDTEQKEVTKTEEVKEEKVGEVSKDTLMDETEGLSGAKTETEEKTSSSKTNYMIIALVVAVIVLVALLIGIVYVKKSKK